MKRLLFMFCFSGAVCLCVAPSKAVDAKAGAASKNLEVMNQQSHSLGRINLLDYLVPKTPTGAKGDVETPLRHIFTLKNSSSVPVSISSLEADCGCLRSAIENADLAEQPYVVPPNGQVEVKVEIDPTLVKAGTFDHSVNVKTKGQNQPLASLNVRGIVEDGIWFGTKQQSEDVLRFSSRPRGMPSSRLIYMTLDRRLPTLLPPGTKLRLVATDSLISVKLASYKPISRKRATDEKLPLSSNNVQLDGDLLTFSDNTALAEDCVLTYRVTLNKEAPAGQFKAYLVLATDKLPQFAALRQIVVPVEGYFHERRSTNTAAPSPQRKTP